MTALIYSDSPIDHTSDAGFRAWAQEFDACIVSAGWLHTADTGQVDLTTAARPAAGSYAGYKTYTDPSSVQGTAPIILRVRYGTANVATYPQIAIQIGSQTNGAGTLTGAILLTETTAFRQAVPVSTVANYKTYLCYKDGYLSITFKVGATSTGLGHFSIHRSMLADHTVVAEAVELYTLGTSGGSVANQITFTPLQIIAASTGIAYIPPGQNISSLSGLDIQTYKHYMSCPRTRCNPCKMTVNITNVPEGTVFDQALTDSTDHTYRCLGIYAGTSIGVGAPSTVHVVATLWE